MEESTHELSTTRPTYSVGLLDPWYRVTTPPRVTTVKAGSRRSPSARLAPMGVHPVRPGLPLRFYKIQDMFESLQLTKHKPNHLQFFLFYVTYSF